jgi:predicted Zn-dependent protease
VQEPKNTHARYIYIYIVQHKETKRRMDLQAGEAKIIGQGTKQEREREREWKAK